ncbi:MAG: DUF3365 domain-containing protein [Gammaproteobacteria bacterium]|nr:DUF3365 domain-containing protein [Gammaproteobacteria bacterium]
MKYPVLFALLASISFIPAGLVQADGHGLEKRAQESRAVIKQFFGDLKGELVSSLKKDGPVAAIKVCKQVGPAIATKHSKDKGWDIGRTSLKLRNPKNVPDQWEKAVLQKFEARKAAGEDPKKMEFYEVVTENGKKSFRYMKAIPTAEKPCLACHGSSIKAPIVDALDANYPEDKARGYKAGDIRGAFTISQPM